MSTTTVKRSYQAFDKVVGPYLHIQNQKHYKQTLALLENLFEEVEDNDKDPLNGLIDLLVQAVSHYENNIASLKLFEKVANTGPQDVAMLRLLMEQYDLGVADFPEIGDKSLISKILSRKRSLTKQHIQKLSKRFNISPVLFFG